MEQTYSDILYIGKYIIIILYYYIQQIYRWIPYIFFNTCPSSGIFLQKHITKYNDDEIKLHHAVYLSYTQIINVQKNTIFEKW